jgi:GNAT superfamily N-acetyltransferase
MAEIVHFDPDVHMDAFRQMNIATVDWHVEQLLKEHQIDAVPDLGQSVEEYVDDHLDVYAALRPPAGVVYLLLVDREVSGMMALTKLSEDTGELHRMWINTDCRGKGYSRLLLDKVLEAGRDLGCTTFRLSTPRFAQVAQHLYTTAGFTETDAYPETEVPPPHRALFVYMERTE